MKFKLFNIKGIKGQGRFQPYVRAFIVTHPPFVSATVGETKLGGFFLLLKEQ